MASREVSFEEPRTQLRRFIAQSQEDQEDWGAAAEVRTRSLALSGFGS